MVTITSTTYCGSVSCQGHVSTQVHPGQQLVLTDDPARPFALAPAEPSSPEAD